VINAQESLVIRLRFGLDGTRELTLQEIADTLDISKPRVHQIEKSALKKLSKSEKLRSYWEDEYGGC
jgi:RNA polymerase sigma factor (sigma-70 family)